VLQPVAGEFVAAEAVTGFPFPDILTVLDPAGNAGLRFAAVIAPATGARLPVPRMGQAEPAVHAAGSDQLRLHGSCLCGYCHSG